MSLARDLWAVFTLRAHRSRLFAQAQEQRAQRWRIRALEHERRAAIAQLRAENAEEIAEEAVSRELKRAQEWRTAELELHLSKSPLVGADLKPRQLLNAHWLDRDPIPVRVTKVIDGDSLQVRILRRGRIVGPSLEVRLLEIDAPEHDQVLGREARQDLQRMLEGLNFWMFDFGLDYYGRTLGVLLLKNRRAVYELGWSVNREMVRKGLARWYPHFSHFPELEISSAEEEAKREAMGLWASDYFDEAPWERRERDRARKLY